MSLIGNSGPTNPPIGSPSRRVIGVGDSITVGKHAGGKNFLFYGKDHMIETDTAMWADGGTTLQWLWNTRQQAIARRNPNYSRNLWHINSGTNNIAQATSFTGLAESMFNVGLTDLITAYLASGPDARVTINTICARFWLGTPEIRRQRERERLHFNTLVRMHAFGPRVTVADVAAVDGLHAVDEFGTPGGLGVCYVADKVHLTAEGYFRAAGGANAVVAPAWTQAMAV